MDGSMKTWRVEVIPRVEQRLTDILAYISGEPLHNPEAARAVLEDFEATVNALSLMGDRIPIGVHPIMHRRGLRRVNFRNHQFCLIFRLRDDVVQVVCIAHFKEDLNKVLR